MKAEYIFFSELNQHDWRYYHEEGSFDVYRNTQPSYTRIFTIFTHDRNDRIELLKARHTYNERFPLANASTS